MTQPPAGASSTATTAPLQEITITGSRIARTSDFTTPTPTTVIDSEAMQKLGMVNVGQTLQLTPANASTFTPANTGNSPYFIGAYIPDLRGLNPYFGSRTLTLVDGQRFVQTEQGDQIDLNFIPQILVQRIDVVTGGASAAYGSGAIAGVENIILDSKLEGGKIDGDFFQTHDSDARDRHIGAAYGHSVLEGRVHFVVGGEYERQDALGCQDVRTWCAQDRGAYQDAAVLTGPLNPLVTPLAYGSGLRQFSSPYGVFVAPPLGLQGNPGGNGTQPFALPAGPYATYPTAFIDTLPGGGGIPIYQYANLMAPVDRAVFMGLLNGDITDSLHFKASAYWGKVDTTNYQQTVGTTFGYVAPDNAYIQGNSLATDVGMGAFINKDWTTQAPSASEFSTSVRRVTFGLNGQIGDSSWTWDANYEYGLTYHDQVLVNNLHNYASAMALDSVIGPNGQPECRVTADGFAGAVAANPFGGYATANPLIAQGCVPIDPFGNQPLSPAQLAYVFGNLVENLRYQQTDFNINASGDYFQGIGAGAFSAAAGYEFRQEGGSNIDNPGVPSYVASDYNTQFGESFGGIVTVNEVYLETILPLLKDVPAAQLLELDVAGRESRYDNRAQFGIDTNTPGVLGNDYVHDLTTWKASLSWQPMNWLRVRGSQSRDARAANFRELYYGQVIGAGGSFGYCDPSGGRNDPCTWNLEGNVNLRPETSDTTTIGIVLTPMDFARGLQFSADWFHIKINNAIEQANPTILLDGCAAGIASECSQMSFYNPGTTTPASTPAQIAAAEAYYQQCFPKPDGTGAGECVRNVQSITPTSYNGAFYEVKGIDFSLQHTADLGAYGTLTTRLLTTWMDEQIFANCTLGYQAGCYTYSILGQTGTGNGFLNDYTPDARWRGSLIVTWERGPYAITPSMSFVGHGVMDYLGITPAAGKLYTEVVTGVGLPANLQNYGYHPMPYNYVPAYFLFNLNGTYTIPRGSLEGMQLFVQINNLFNKLPPFTGGASAFGPSNAYGGTNPIFFDTLGLAYRVGFRYRF